MFSLPVSTVPTRKRVQFLPCQPQTAGQLHLVVIKETFARVISSHRKATTMHRNQYCQRAHMGSAMRRLADLRWGNSQTIPRSDLTIANMEVYSLVALEDDCPVEWKEGGAPPLEVLDKNRMLSAEREGGEEQI
ncbi:hypothetical protein AVEN_132247-1 [Araneus ventricosus]|uniref:Uncharacterized protein n=1 Tax=Araneus ventricosus TaxID=182803 RepID=A0A4Y2IJY2_ARAVE|nr:hypothetical protein AVEN_132247-1 [Araneus ventricosus]